MLMIQLPHVAGVQAAIATRVREISIQIDVIELTQRVIYRGWIGKKINKRLAKQLAEAMESTALAWRLRIPCGVDKIDPIPIPGNTTEAYFKVRWYPAAIGSGSTSPSIPVARLPDRPTVADVAAMYTHSAHPDALRRTLAALAAYGRDTRAIQDAVDRYCDAAHALEDAALAAGPRLPRNNQDGSDAGGDTEVLYPINQWFPQPMFTEHRN